MAYKDYMKHFWLSNFNNSNKEAWEGGWKIGNVNPALGRLYVIPISPVMLHSYVLTQKEQGIWATFCGFISGMKTRVCLSNTQVSLEVIDSSSLVLISYTVPNSDSESFELRVIKDAHASLVRSYYYISLFRHGDLPLLPNIP